MEKCLGNFYAHQVPLNHLQTAILKLLGGMGPVATTWAPVGAEVPILSPNDHPNQSQGREKGFGKRHILKNFKVSQNNLHNSNFGAFGGPMARARWA